MIDRIQSCNSLEQYKEKRYRNNKNSLNKKDKDNEFKDVLRKVMDKVDWIGNEENEDIDEYFD